MVKHTSRRDNELISVVYSMVTLLSVPPVERYTYDLVVLDVDLDTVPDMMIDSRYLLNRTFKISANHLEGVGSNGNRMNQTTGKRRSECVDLEIRMRYKDSEIHKSAACEQFCQPAQ